MSGYAELEIAINRHNAGGYAIDLRFSLPDSEAEVRLQQGQEPQAEFELEALRTLILDPEAYGRKLFRNLFSDPDLLSAFAQARAAAQAADLPLRLRLLIGPTASNLHNLHWEMLRDPQSGAPLCTDENLLFSRYLSSLDWRPVRLRPKGALGALAVVANPSDIDKYRLSPIDVQAEFEHAQQGLGEISHSLLPQPATAQRATLNNILDSLRQQEFDILYLACHGTLAKDEPWIWLEDEQGQTARTSGRELVNRLRELRQRPRLIVLASCQSAGDSAGEALSALGPRLAEAGIPAVVAMQGNISMGTSADFMAVFFAELQRDGQIDRAMALARGAVRESPDHWMPALFMRLKSGRLWYSPGFGGDQPEFEKWESLSSAILEGNSTALLGPNLVEPLLGRRSEIALGWAQKHVYPLAPFDREDLPRVAQYVVTRQDPKYIRTAFRESLREEILLRHSEALAEELQTQPRWSPKDLLQAIEQAAAAYWATPQDNPYHHLARLHLPIYVSADHHDLLKQALIAAGAEPVVRLCPWNELIPTARCIYEEAPTPEKPLIYHLFGHLEEPFSLVITEDEYFDYLIGVTVNKELIPEAVRAALTSSALLFLGFQMDDWEFRVLFRMIMAQGGRAMLRLFSHVAVQIEPEEGRILDAQRARTYLEKYFDSENISLYWGSSGDFLHNLAQHLSSNGTS